MYNVEHTPWVAVQEYSAASIAPHASWLKQS